MELKLPKHALDKHKRVTTRQAYECVRDLRNFETHGNLYGEWRSSDRRLLFPEQDNHLYVVRSYAAPIYVYDLKTQHWYANMHKYSRTTSRHQSAAHPGVACTDVSREDMDVIARHGFVGFAALRMQGRA